MRISDWSSDVCSSDLRGTGAGATGLGDAGATFPDPHADGLRIEDLGEFDVDALREQRVMLDLRTDLADRHGLGVGYEEHHMGIADRSEEHTSELQSLMRISYAVFCLKKKTSKHIIHYLFITTISHDT